VQEVPPKKHPPMTFFLNLEHSTLEIMIIFFLAAFQIQDAEALHEYSVFFDQTKPFEALAAVVNTKNFLVQV